MLIRSSLSSFVRVLSTRGEQVRGSDERTKTDVDVSLSRTNRSTHIVLGLHFVEFCS